MNFKRIGRSLICLLLVCTLLIGVSPIRAKAAVVPTVLVAASSVITSAIIGLGVFSQTYEIAKPYVEECITYIEESTEYIEDGLVDVWVQYPDAATEYENAMAYVDQGLVEAVRDWLFDSEVIVEESTSAPDGYAYYNGYCYPCLPSSVDLEAYPYLFINTTKPYLFMCSGPLGFPSSKYLANYNDFDVVYRHFTLRNGSWVLSEQLNTLPANSQVSLFDQNSYIWSNYDMLNKSEQIVLAASEPVTAIPGDMSVADGLEAGYIAPQSQTLDEGYAEWVKNKIDIALEEMYEAHITGLPIALGGTDKETAELDQSAVWAGLGTWSGTGTGGTTNPDIGTGDDTDIGEEDDKIAVPFPDLGTSGGSTSVDTSTWTDADWWAYETESTAIGFNSLFSAISALPKAIANAFAKPFENVSAWISNQTMAISNFFDSAVAGINENIIQLFVPAEGFLTAEVEALCSEFNFVNSLVTTAKAITGGLEGISTSPPIIYIDLGATRGSYNMGGKTVFVDLSWYEEYKPTVDNIISAFLWICFVWKMLIKAPGIISGMPGDWVMSSANAIGITEHLPSRKAEYEVQRISNRETIRKGKG